MPAGWVYDLALELIAAILAKADPLFAHEVLQGRTDCGGYLDLRSIDVKRFQALTQAAQEALTRVTSSGRSQFKDPAFFDGFVTHLTELQEMLRGDPRAAHRFPMSD